MLCFMRTTVFGELSGQCYCLLKVMPLGMILHQVIFLPSVTVNHPDDFLLGF